MEIPGAEARLFRMAGTPPGKRFEPPFGAGNASNMERSLARGKNAAPLTVLLVQQSERTKQARNNRRRPSGNKRA